jgi:chromosome segregation ATPase
MANGTDRLDRIEAILADVAESQRRTQQAQEVNTGAIAGLRRSVQEVNTSIGETNQQLRESIADIVELLTTLAEQQGQRHDEADQRFNNLLEDARADRQRSEERADANEREHQAFRESFQSLLAEIRAIWQRLAG